MDNIFESFYKSESAAELYADFLKAIDMYSMADKIKEGVLIGLSGGADSVMLMLLLKKYQMDIGGFSIAALHVNHGIRGDEADRDESFSLELARRADIEVFSVKIDCPGIKRKEGGSLEEIARNARYSEFQRIIQSRKDLSCVAVAHNSDDNIETVLFNLMRGTGTAGLCGIPPVRDNIIRPMILLKKKDIVNALEKSGIPYVTDSTNLDEDYSRNFIRSRIVPAMLEFSDDLHELTARASYNLRTDNSFIDSVAEDFYSRHRDECHVSELRKLHPAVLSRVIKLIAKSVGCPSVEFTHINKIISLLNKDNFSYSLPGGFIFVCEYGNCSIKSQTVSTSFWFALNEEYTEISDFSAAVVISSKKTDKISSNVYNFSIHADLSSAIINNGIFVRSKQDGDSYRYGGITHKLKKLFNDCKIPPSLRDRIPVFCDDSGILWVPGFGVRDDNNTSGEKKHITLLLNSVDGDGSFFIPRQKQ